MFRGCCWLYVRSTSFSLTKVSHWRSATAPRLVTPPVNSKPAVANRWPLSGEMAVANPVSGPRPVYARSWWPSAFGCRPKASAQSPPPPAAIWPRGANPSRWKDSPPSVDTWAYSASCEEPVGPHE